MRCAAPGAAPHAVFVNTQRNDLHRSLTPLNATAMVAGTIIGASIFVQPSEIARHLETPGAIMAVWIASGVLTLFGAMVCAELASAYPHTGGLYVFLRDTFSPLAGFLWGWAMFWTMHSGIVAAIATVFARYAGHFVPLGDWETRFVAALVIAVLSAINYFGVRAGSRVQTVLTIAKLAAIALIVTVGFGFGIGNPPPAAVVAGASSFSDFLLAMVAGLFAYGGWHMVTYTAGETVMPARTVPVALLVGVAIVTGCYIALNLVYLLVLPLDVVRTSTRVAADAADAVMGRGGSAFLAALVMISSFGALTGIVLTGPRVYYSMAQDGLAFRWLAHVHPVYQTPSRAIVAQGIWSIVLVLTGAYRTLFTRVIYTEWLFFALMASGLFLLRRRADYHPPYRAWGYPAVPALFIAASLVIVINQIYRQPYEAAFGLGLVAIGAPIYYLAHARH
jgi:APA family basic amino acid/polyamine antiporter